VPAGASRTAGVQFSFEMQLVPVGDKIVKVIVTASDPEIDLSKVTVTVDRATVWDLKQARAADPEGTKRLVEFVQSHKRDSRPYRSSRIGFAAIAKGK
jgi:hypothetical protein